MIGFFFFAFGAFFGVMATLEMLSGNRINGLLCVIVMQLFVIIGSICVGRRP